jgi:hypothetical protein
MSAVRRVSNYWLIMISNEVKTQQSNLRKTSFDFDESHFIVDSYTSKPLLSSQLGFPTNMISDHRIRISDQKIRISNQQIEISHFRPCWTKTKIWSQTGLKPLPFDYAGSTRNVDEPASEKWRSGTSSFPIDRGAGRKSISGQFLF